MIGNKRMFEQAYRRQRQTQQQDMAGYRSPQMQQAATNIPGVGVVRYPTFNQDGASNYFLTGDQEYLRRFHDFGTRLDPEDWKRIEPMLAGYQQPTEGQAPTAPAAQPPMTQAPAQFPTSGRYGLLALQMAGQNMQGGGLLGANSGPPTGGGLLGMPPSRIPMRY